MGKRKNRGPSCLGSVMLLAVIILGLKIAYDHVPEEKVTVYEEKNSVSENTAEGYTSAESVYNVLERELSAYSSEVVFTYDCTDVLFDAFEDVCDDHPELFWLNGSGTSEKRTIGNDTTVTLKPESLLTLVDILNCQTELNEQTDKILAAVDPEWTDYEKILYIHDYIVKNTEYDTACAEAIANGMDYEELWQSSSAYGCLVKKQAVCSGYAAAFHLLMNKLEIPCMRVSGTERESGVLHEWNCVRLGEKWYYVDITWDDPTFEDETSIFRDFVTHEYFLISEDMLLQTHLPDPDESVPECSDMSQSYYMRENRFLTLYSYPEAAMVIASQLDQAFIEIQFANRLEAQKAKEDLFDRYMIYQIEDIAAMQNAYVTYSIGRNGLLRMIVTEEQ